MKAVSVRKSVASELPHRLCGGLFRYKSRFFGRLKNLLYDGVRTYNHIVEGGNVECGVIISHFSVLLFVDGKPVPITCSWGKK